MITPVTISELTRDIKHLIENEFQFVYVVAEISNFKHHLASGHYYFTLKDDKAQISANMWNSRTKDLTFTPDTGKKVLVKGRLTLYETRGTYQIDVFEMLPFGVGDLQMAFEQLKQKLLAEGLFEEEYKKAIPLFPERVGIVTSESGAALQDFLKVTKKRYPIVKLFLIHANMQGAGSPESICKAIRIANNPELGLDILVITRGGGSMEDLWSFNDEKVAREIFRSEIPVVTAIGHEVDFTISDFVADLRAATPSAAAENIFPDQTELYRYIDDAGEELNERVKLKFNKMKTLLENISNNYYFKRPADLLNENKVKLDDFNRRLNENVKAKLLNLSRFLNTSEKIIKSIGPEQTLKRGFTITKKDGKVISSKNKIRKNDIIEIVFYDGEKIAIINN